MKGSRQTPSPTDLLALVEDANDVVYFHDLSGQVIWCNQAAARVLGHGVDAILQMNIKDVVHPEDRPIVAAKLKEKLDGVERSEAYAVRVRRADGSWASLEVNTRLVRRDGQPVGVQGIGRDITEREALRATIEAKDQQLHNILEQLPVGVYRTTPDGRLLEGNQALAQLFGASNVEELRRHAVPSLFVDHEARPAHIQERTASQKIARQDLHLRRLDGSTFWARDVGRTVRDEAGSVLYFEGTLEDVTEARRLAEALRQSEEKYRSLVAQLPVGVYRTTAEGEFLDANPTFLSILGFSSLEELRRTPVSSVYHDAQDRESFLGRLRASTGPVEVELYLRKRGGGDIWVRVVARAVRDGDVITSIDGSLVDVTKRKRAEEALRESEARVRSLVERVPVGLFRATHDGQLLEVNPALVRMLGYNSKEEVMAKRMDQHYADPEERKQILKLLLQGPDERGEWPVFEGRFRRADGSIGWTRGTSRPHFGPNGDIVYLEGHLEDITKRRRAESGVRFLHGLAIEINQARDFRASLQLVLDSVTQATGWAYGEAWIPDAGGDRMVWSGASAMGRSGLERFRHFSERMHFAVDEDAIGIAWANGRPVVIDDLSRHEHFVRASAASAVGLNCAFVLPVTARGETVAVLVFMHDRFRAEDQDWLEVLRTLANQLAGVFLRRRVEDNLHFQQMLMQAQIETMGDAMLAVSHDGTLLTANRRFFEICGVAKPDPDASKPVLDRVPDPTAFLEVVQHLYQSPATSQRDEVQYRGRRFIRASTPIDDHGRRRGRVWTFREVA
jgi:PAS domain S-box-containing protein